MLKDWLSISPRILNIFIAAIAFGFWMGSWLAGLFMLGALSALDPRGPE